MEKAGISIIEIRLFFVENIFYRGLKIKIPIEHISFQSEGNPGGI